MSIATTPVKASFQLKGTLFTFHVLTLLDTDLATTCQQLGELVKQSPKFFNHAPIVLDIHRIDPDSIDFVELLRSLRDLDLNPIGIKKSHPAAEELARTHQLAVFTGNRTPDTEPSDKLASAEPKPTMPKSKPSATATGPTTPSAKGEKEKSYLITQPVRSGQQLYAQSSDLIVHAPVSYGAELIADGNIHVYGPLRGRALAGVSGDTSARIYCQSLEAELISIAGHYWLSDDLRSAHKQSVCIHLENDQLVLDILSKNNK